MQAFVQKSAGKKKVGGLEEPHQDPIQAAILFYHRRHNKSCSASLLHQPFLVLLHSLTPTSWFPRHHQHIFLPSWLRNLLLVSILPPRMSLVSKHTPASPGSCSCPTLTLPLSCAPRCSQLARIMFQSLIPAVPQLRRLLNKLQNPPVSRRMQAMGRLVLDSPLPSKKSLPPKLLLLPNHRHLSLPQSIRAPFPRSPQTSSRLSASHSRVDLYRNFE